MPISVLPPWLSKDAIFNAAMPDVRWPGEFELTWWEYPGSRQEKQRIAYGPDITEMYDL